jgi:hypothetical protein
MALAAAIAAAACSASPSSTPTPSTASSNATRSSAGHGNPILYQPLAGSNYVLQRRDSLSVQLPNGLQQTQLFVRTAHFTVSVGAGTPMPVSVTLDSLAVEGPMAAQAAIDSARGAQWTGSITPTGHLTNLVAVGTSSVAEQFRGMLAMFFPNLPAGGAREGMQWTDSSQTSLRAMAFDVKERSVDSLRAGADTAQGSARGGLRIDSHARFTRAGGGSQFGQAVEVQATGNRQLVSRLMASGTLISIEGTEQSDMTLTIPAVGQSLPVKQYATFSVTRAGAGH